jgi:hypothetical protein
LRQSKGHDPTARLEFHCSLCFYISVQHRTGSGGTGSDFPTLCRGDSKGAPELTSKEQQQLKSLHQEMAESWQSLQQAGKNWRDYQHQLAVDRFPTKVDNQVVVSSPWANGLAFTPDFRFAVPRTH